MEDYSSVSLYPVTAVLWAFMMSYYFTGNAIYTLVGGWLSIAMLCLIIYTLGAVGAYLSNKLVYTRIIKAKMH